MNRIRSIFVTAIGALALITAVAARAGSATAASHTISGMVLDASQKPAAAVEVKLLVRQPAHPVGPITRPPGESQAGESAPNQLQKAQGGEVGRNEKILQHGTTDAAGKFNFANVAPGKYIVLAGTGKVAVRGEVEITDADPPAMKLTLKAP